MKSGQVKLQSRLDEEDEAKAALMGRIQRLTKLILVSTKTSLPTKTSAKPDHIWRHTFAEDEVCMLSKVLEEKPFHFGGTLIFFFSQPLLSYDDSDVYLYTMVSAVSLLAR